MCKTLSNSQLMQILKTMCPFYKTLSSRKLPTLPSTMDFMGQFQEHNTSSPPLLLTQTINTRGMEYSWIWATRFQQNFVLALVRKALSFLVYLNGRPWQRLPLPSLLIPRGNKRGRRDRWGLDIEKLLPFLNALDPFERLCLYPACLRTSKVGKPINSPLAFISVGWIVFHFFLSPTETSYKNL